MPIRPRRNRLTPSIRSMVAETSLSVQQLVQPLFVADANNVQKSISAIPGIFQYSLDNILREVEECLKLNLTNFILFPIIEQSLKDDDASYSHHPRNFFFHAIRMIKQEFPETCLIGDVSLNTYHPTGADGIIIDNKVDNDRTLPILAAISLAQCDAGIDILAPSDMMDGRVGYIREVLEDQGFSDISIMAHSVKYASSFYQPFRNLMESNIDNNSKKCYQLNPANIREAIREAQLDIAEDVDFLMVTPALHYLDVIHRIKEQTNLPLAAFHVSGEYAMLKAAAQNGWLDYHQSLEETLISIKRAGADIVISYGAKDFAKLRKS
ncbi:MAG: porphobilinogen synthase [Chitinophagales bacterium]|nr:porphobilinogen synthase [Chitinophagales bacterium]